MKSYLICAAALLGVNMLYGATKCLNLMTVEHVDYTEVYGNLV